MDNIKLINGSDEFNISLIGSAVGFEYPETRISIQELAGDQSAKYITSKSGMRRLSFQTILNTKTDRRTLFEMARAGSLKTFEFDTCDNLSLEIDVEIERITSPYKNGRSIALIEMVAPDWRFYSQTVHEFETAQTVITGGFGIPASIPLDMSGGDTVIANTVTNAGNDVTNPTFIINGPCTGFLLGNQTTNEEMVIEYTLSASETIEIDVKNRTILLDGTTSIYSSLISGNFWSLVPGDNIIRFLPEGEDVETLLTINWQDAYVGI